MLQLFTLYLFLLYSGHSKRHQIGSLQDSIEKGAVRFSCTQAVSIDSII